MFASPVHCLISPSAARGIKPGPGLIAYDDEVMVAGDQLVADVYPLLNDVSRDGAPISFTGLLEAPPAGAGTLQVDGSRIVYRRAPDYGGATFAVGYRGQSATGAQADGDISFIVAAPATPPLTFPKDPPAAVGSPVAATAATFATVYGAATAGQHIVLADGDYGTLTLNRNFSPTQPVVIRAANPGVPRLTGLINVSGTAHWLYQLNLANVPTGLAGLSRANRLAKMQVQVTAAGDRYLWITRCFLRSEIAVRIGPRVHYVKLGYNLFDGRLTSPNGAHIDIEQGLFTDANDAVHDVLVYRNDFEDRGTRWLDGAGVPIENHHVFVYQGYTEAGLRSLRNVVIAENRFKNSKRRCWALSHLGCAILDNDVDMPDAAASPYWTSTALIDPDYSIVTLPVRDVDSSYFFNALANRVYDGRDRVYTHAGNSAILLSARDSHGPAVVTGAKFVSTIAPTVTWKTRKGDGQLDVGGIRLETDGLAIVEGIWMDRLMDGIRIQPSDYGAASHIVRHSYFRNMHDDIIENDSCSQVDVEDLLVDGCVVFYSERPGSSGTCPNPQKTTNIRRCIVEIKPQAYDTGVPIQNGNIFKLGPNTGPVNVSDCVFLVYQPRVGASETAANGKYFFPTSGTHSNNIICWMGTATYGAFPVDPDTPLPAGFTVVNDDRSAFDAARAAWLSAHGSTNGDDFPWLHAGSAPGPVITATADTAPMAADAAWAEANVLANDAISPASAGLKVAQVRTVAGSGPSGSGLVVPTIINGGAPGGNNVRVTRNAEPAGTVRVQYKPSSADGVTIHPSWVNLDVTIASSAAWWNFTGMRSARANGRRSGISYWGASSSVFATNLDRFERQVAFCDAWNGGQPDAADATMDMVTGGPNTTDNDTITAGSALDFSGSSSHWRAGWNGLPGGSIAIWACNLTSHDRRTDEGDGSIWTDIIDGDFDRHFTNMGRRLKKNFDTPALNPRGHLPSRLLIRMNHENNQSNYYRVLVAQKANYVNAMNRAIDKIRVGLGTTYANQVKFMHAPAHGSEGIDLGSYASWCPSNVDVLSVSWHPRAAQNSALKLTEYNNGEDNPINYGLSEVLAYSELTGKPMCFPEWSPRFEAGTGVACPVADLAMDSFDAFLTTNAARIICDCVYHQKTLDVNGYAPTDTAGKEAWARSVAVFKTKWSGVKKT